MKSITITENEAEQRLDRFLLKYFNNTNRNNLYKLIRKKVFKVNGVRVKEDYFLKLDDVIDIYLADESFDALIKPVRQVKPEQTGLDIVYEDDNILIVNKPKNLLTHPDKNEYKNTLATIVQYYLKHLCTNTFKPAPVHRLDKNTSGLVLFAKNYESLKKYNEQMRNREIHKHYLCVVEGVLKGEGEVKGYIEKDEVANKVRLLKEETDESKFIHTAYRAIRRVRGYTLVDVELFTGRSHQIRVSMAYLGYPIVGDVKYGGKKVKATSTQLLHAYALTIDGTRYEAPSEEIDEFIFDMMQ